MLNSPRERIDGIDVTRFFGSPSLFTSANRDRLIRWFHAGWPHTIAPLLALLTAIHATRLIQSPAPWLSVLGLLALTGAGLSRPIGRLSSRTVGLQALLLLGGLSLLWSWAPGEALIWLQWLLIALAVAVWATSRGMGILLVGVTAYHAFMLVVVNSAGYYLYPSLWFNKNLAGIGAVCSLLLLCSPFSRGFSPGWRTLFMGLSIYALAASGSRGVYIAALLLLPGVLVLRARWANWKDLGALTRSRREAGLMLAGALALCVVVDVAVPNHPAWRQLTGRTSIEKQQAELSNSGSFDWRWKMKQQTYGALWTHPLGVGAGSYASTSLAVQTKPFITSVSPHDFFAYLALTLGWPGLAIVVALFLFGLWQAWRAQDSFFLVQIALIWCLFIDVGDYVPGFLIMSLAIFCLDDSWNQSRLASKLQMRSSLLSWSWLGWVAVWLGLLAYWWLPLGQTPQQRLARHLYPMWETRIYGRGQQLVEAQRINTHSLWPLRVRMMPDRNNCDLILKVVQQFPLVNPLDYLHGGECLKAQGRQSDLEDLIVRSQQLFPTSMDADISAAGNYGIDLPAWRRAMLKLK